jgi:hypothetical protein
MTDLLKNPIFLDETAAREWLEARVWANGPHCSNADQDKLTKHGAPSGRVPVQRAEMPPAVHRDREHSFRALQNPADQVACRTVPDDRFQERHWRASGSPYAWHLHRYPAEFDFRHNNRIALGIDDNDRASELAKGIVGKRLTYRRPNAKHAQA